jgi:hypothetical protein
MEPQQRATLYYVLSFCQAVLAGQPSSVTPRAGPGAGAGAGSNGEASSSQPAPRVTAQTLTMALARPLTHMADPSKPFSENQPKSAVLVVYYILKHGMMDKL